MMISAQQIRQDFASQGMTRRHVRELQTWILDHPWNVFGTLKFQSNSAVPLAARGRLFRSWQNQIDRMFFGKAAQLHGLRVPRISFVHLGRANDNCHLHFVAQAPGDLTTFCCASNVSWHLLHQDTAPLAENWIMPASNRRLVARYLCHEYWRLGSDTLVPELCNTRPLPTLPEQCLPDQQRRIDRVLNGAWHGQALETLADQKAWAQARYVRRNSPS